MSQTLSTLNPFAPKGEAQSAAGRMIPFLVGLSSILLVVLVGYAVVSASRLNVEQTGDAFLAANPELMVASRYVGPVERASEVNFLAANPELMVARRYAPEIPETTDAAFLAANPELKIVRNYIGPVEKGSAVGFLTANPELMVARRFTADTSKTTDATFLAANPEIMVYRRYVASTPGQQ